MIEEDLPQGRPSSSTRFAEQVMAFTKLFSALVNGGASLTHCLKEIAENETDALFRAAIEDIRARLQAGETLSMGMRHYPQYFADEYLTAVREGEWAGCLEVSLEKLANGTYSRGSIYAASLPSF